MHVLPTPFPWYLSGPATGMCVSGMYALTNKHMGISGSFGSLVTMASSKGRVISWRVTFLLGTVIGAALVAILGGSPQTGLEYGTLSEHLSLPALVLVLFAGCVLIGYGARMAGGCTSGHGITGCATRSPGSFVAVSIFVVTAVLVTLVLNALTGWAV